MSRLALAVLLAASATVAPKETVAQTEAVANGDPTPTDSTAASLVVPRISVRSAVVDSAAADPLDALDGYLGSLSLETDQDFLLEQLSISDAEIDSLIRIYEETGEVPGAVGSPPVWNFRGSVGSVRYNRVEGLNVMGDVSLAPPTRNPWSAFLRAGYGWASHEATWRGGFRTEFPRFAGHPGLEVTHARDVYAYGAGGLPGNSFLALTAGRDWDDYFLGEGFTVGLSLFPGPARVSLSWSGEDQESLPVESNFTLFGEGEFRPNPTIDDGASRRIMLGLDLGDSGFGRLAGNVRGTIAGHGLGGDFEYETVAADVVARRRLWFGDEVRVKVGGAIVTGEPPVQALYFLGGTSRLRGYDVNELPARQAAHLALDYKLGRNPLRWVPYLRRIRIQPVPFFDAAGIFETQTRDGTVVELDDARWRFSAGLGLQYNFLGIPGGGGQARFDITRRLDRDDDSWTYRLGFTIER